MAQKNAEGTKDKVQPIKAEKGQRQRSAIAFPYFDLSEAISIARAIHDKVGTGTCDLEQLAAWLKLSANSSGFRSRIGAAKLFGVIATDRANGVTLTDIGLQIVDAKREREGRVKAFLSVPLFSAVFEKLKSGALPPSAALESELVALGVAPSLRAIARQVLERSADKAGFFEAGKDRLVKPGFKESAGAGRATSDFGGGGGDDLPPVSGLHPMIQVLVDALPESGSAWPQGARTKWLQSLSRSFETIYRNNDGEA